MLSPPGSARRSSLPGGTGRRRGTSPRSRGRWKASSATSWARSSPASDPSPQRRFGLSWPAAVSWAKVPIPGLGFPWISLDSLVRLETYQWVTRDSPESKFFGPLVLGDPARDGRKRPWRGEDRAWSKLSVISAFLQENVGSAFLQKSSRRARHHRRRSPQSKKQTALTCELTQIGPGVEAGVVSVVEHDLDRVIADRFEADNGDVFLAGDDPPLARRMALDLGARAHDAQLLSGEPDRLAVVEGDLQRPALVPGRDVGGPRR